jgi:hypothetical protein
MPTIDWSEFDKYPESICECRCRTSYHSHAKAIREGIEWKLVSKTPCPSCGKADDLRSIRSPPETMTLKG